MYARYLNAPLLLLLWQVAPVRVSVGIGGGDFAFLDSAGWPAGTSCAGDYPAQAPFTEALSYSSRDISAEFWARRNLRVRAALGGVTDFLGERQGTFGGAQAVLEQKNYGIGLGFAHFAGSRSGVQPSASLRLGSLDGISLRADYHQPQTGMGLRGGPRIGVGWNDGQNLKPRLFLGLATTPVPDSARKAGGYLELAVPLGMFRSGLLVNAFLGGQYRGIETKRIYSLGVGAWIQP